MDGRNVQVRYEIKDNSNKKSIFIIDFLFIKNIDKGVLDGIISMSQQDE